jgi:hypothetical protein
MIRETASSRTNTLNGSVGRYFFSLYSEDLRKNVARERTPLYYLLVLTSNSLHVLPRWHLPVSSVLLSSLFSFSPFVLNNHRA